MIAFDLDGTLFEYVEQPDWENWESICANERPVPGAKEALKLITDATSRVRFVTNRSQAVATAAAIQLSSIGQPEAVTYHRPEWMHWGSSRDFKAGVLKGLGRGVYVGDLLSDREAARLAGWAFIPVDEFLLHPKFVLELEVIYC